MKWVKRHKFWVSVIFLLVAVAYILGNSTNLHLASGLMLLLVGYVVLGQAIRFILHLRRGANNAK